jgi:hypothetical protein
LDQREQEDDPTKPATYVKLNDGEAFIARLMVQGIDTTKIPEILKSEYSYLGNTKLNNINFVAEVDTVYKLLKPYLEDRTRHRAYEPPKDIAERLREGGYVKKHLDKDGITVLKGYDLDFRVNWFVSGCCKFPG